MIPYARQQIEADDVAAMVAALRAPFLTTGPKVAEFEAAFADHVGADHAVAVNSGTAALHAAMQALSIGPGDDVIVPAITFAATANCALFQGATPVIVDVEAERLLIDPERVEAAVTPRTRAIIAVDYAGHPCAYDELRAIAEAHHLALVTDGCHALGARWRGRQVGEIADLTCFSFHPVKHLCTGEGGMVTTADARLAAAMRSFRSHCMSRDFCERERSGGWEYDVTDLGFNYRLTDMQCALGVTQLAKQSEWLARRRELARGYRDRLAGVPLVRPLPESAAVEHAYHLFVVRVPAGARRQVFERLRASGVGVNVHYRPLNLHTIYQRRLGAAKGDCPVAEAAYQEILSLPMYPGLRDEELDEVVDKLAAALAEARA